MKTLLTLLIALAGLCVLPLQEAQASNRLSDAIEQPSKARMGVVNSTAFKKNRQALKVKNRKQAASLVKARYKAKVLSVNASEVNGNPGYRAKLLGDNGTVFYVYIDATTGQMRRS